MKKKEYAVIGHPIGHTMSPFIHNRLFALAGIDAQYAVLDIAPEDLDAAYKEKLKKLDGYNITIPHKQSIIHHLDTLHTKASLYGSVNTVLNGETSVGYTTDPDGFLTALNAAGIPLTGKVVIAGTGGVARIMAFEAVRAGADVTIAVRREDIHTVSVLCGEIMTTIPGAYCASCFLDRIGGDIDLLINATPVGMYPHTDAMPVSEEVVKRAAAVFDAVYNPLETTLLKTAKQLGKKTLGGMSMLVWQAVVSHKIWNNSTYSNEQIAKLCDDSAGALEELFT